LGDPADDLETLGKRVVSFGSSRAVWSTFGNTASASATGNAGVLLKKVSDP
jgi:hypothetical protein